MRLLITGFVRKLLGRYAVPFLLFVTFPSLVGTIAVSRMEAQTELSLDQTIVDTSPKTEPSSAPPAAAETPAGTAPAPMPETPPPARDTAAAAPHGLCGPIEAEITRTHAGRVTAASGRTGVLDLLGSMAKLLVSDAPTVGWIASFDGPAQTLGLGERDERETDSMYAEHGFVGGWVQTWQSPDSWTSADGGSVDFAIQQFASTKDAIAFDEESLRNACTQIDTTFVVPDVDGATGTVITGAPAPVNHEVTFVRGSRRYVVSLGLPARTGYDEIRRLSTLQDALAR